MVTAGDGGKAREVGEGCQLCKRASYASVDGMVTTAEAATATAAGPVAPRYVAAVPVCSIVDTVMVVKVGLQEGETDGGQRGAAYNGRETDKE